MMLFVECKPDETLALALGVSKRRLEHSLHRSGVCSRLSRRSGITGMVDEDPGSALHPYMRSLKEESWEYGIRALVDGERKNRLVVITPRLEEWLVQTAKDAGLKMTDFGFQSDKGLFLHKEINQRLPNLANLTASLVSARSRRILRLQSLINSV